MSDQKGFSLVEALLIIILIGAISFAGYFVYSRQNSGQKLYLEAYENGLSLKDNQQAYTSFDIEAESSRLTGESQGDLTGKNNKYKVTYTANSTYKGIPYSAVYDIIGIHTPGKSESYTRNTDVSSQNPELNEILLSSLGADLNKWEVRYDNGADEDYEQATFKDNGIFAAFDASGLFVPAASFSQRDREAVVNAIEFHKPFSVKGKIEQVQFKGKPARKLVVTLNKNAFKKYGVAGSKSVSKSAGWQVTNSTLLDEFFGGKPDFSANVYLDQNEIKIIGVETDIHLASPAKDGIIDEDFQNVRSSLFVEYDRTLQIDIPQASLASE